MINTILYILLSSQSSEIVDRETVQPEIQGAAVADESVVQVKVFIVLSLTDDEQDPQESLDHLTDSDSSRQIPSMDS